MRAAAERIVRDAIGRANDPADSRARQKERAADGIAGRSNDVIREAILLVQRERVQPSGLVADRTDVRITPVLGDRVQLQQVMINLLMNGVEAMAATRTAREILIRSQQHEARPGARVRCWTPASGLTPQTAEQLFSAFFTTKPSGWEWDCRSAVRSSGPTVAVVGIAKCGPRRGFSIHRTD